MHGGGAAAAAAAVARAIKASGTLVSVDPQVFQAIVNRQDDPLVVRAEGWLYGTMHKYLTSYKGLAFYTRTREPLTLPGRAEILKAKKMWTP
jgi:hypothetical protein